MYRRLLKRNIRSGTLTLVLPGKRLTFGSGDPVVEWIFHSRATPWRIARNPDLQLGETYINGEWDVGQGGLAGLFELLTRNFPERGEPAFIRWGRQFFNQWNHVARSRRNAAHHYDLEEWLFRLFLDREMNYSCAYFEREDASLEEAQEAKCRHILRKLHLKPGQRVLDIGCGWGSLARYLSRTADVHVTGLTLSQRQHQVAEQWAAAEGLGERTEFLLQDYREHRGRYDRIVSVGMFEHVGRPMYPRFFQQVAHLLKDDGVALLHYIGRLGPGTTTSAWIRRHIFPGGYCPALSEVCNALEHSELMCTDIEVLRLHYALTLAIWQQRFQANREAVCSRLGERFARTWEMYLAMAEAGFRWNDMVVHQIQMARRRDALPLTRDYLYRPSEDKPEPSARPETSPHGQRRARAG